MESIKKLLMVGALASLTLAARAVVVFDNGSQYNGSQFQVGDGQTIGNEVTLGSGIYLTNFMFEYYSTNLTFNPSLAVDVKFYTPNGTPSDGNPTPGTLLFDSGWFDNSGGAFDFANTHSFTNDISYGILDFYGGTSTQNLYTGLPGNRLPSDFIWTLTFKNLGGAVIQIPLANNTAGASYGTYWLQTGTSWSLLTNTVPANFVSQFAGTVPEPSTFALGAIGSVILLGINRLRRKI